MPNQHAEPKDTDCGMRRILRHGLAVVELAENDLPGVPSAVFAFKEVRQAQLLYLSCMYVAHLRAYTCLHRMHDLH